MSWNWSLKGSHDQVLDRSKQDSRTPAGVKNALVEMLSEFAPENEVEVETYGHMAVPDRKGTAVLKITTV